MKNFRKIITILLFVSTIEATTLVTVGGTAITQNDVDVIFAKELQKRTHQMSISEEQKIKKEILNKLVVETWAYNEAKKTGVLNSKEFKEEYLKRLHKIKVKLSVIFWQQNILSKITETDNNTRRRRFKEIAKKELDELQRRAIIK